MAVKGLLIDTNIYSWALRGDQNTISVLRRFDKIGISSISIGELLSGFKGGKQEKENKELLLEFLDSPNVQVYSIDEETAEFYAVIMLQLKKTGSPIPTNDIWIAAVAFQQNLSLFSFDQHFTKINELKLV